MGDHNFEVGSYYRLSSTCYLYYFQYLGTGIDSPTLHRVFHYYTSDNKGSYMYNEEREWRMNTSHEVIKLTDSEVIDKILMEVI